MLNPKAISTEIVRNKLNRLVRRDSDVKISLQGVVDEYLQVHRMFFKYFRRLREEMSFAGLKDVEKRILLFAKYFNLEGYPLTGEDRQKKDRRIVEVYATDSNARHLLCQKFFDEHGLEFDTANDFHKDVLAIAQRKREAVIKHVLDLRYRLDNPLRDTATTFLNLVIERLANQYAQRKQRPNAIIRSSKQIDLYIEETLNIYSHKIKNPEHEQAARQILESFLFYGSREHNLEQKYRYSYFLMLAFSCHLEVKKETRDQEVKDLAAIGFADIAEHVLETLSKHTHSIVRQLDNSMLPPDRYPEFFTTLFAFAHKFSRHPLFEKYGLKHREILHFNKILESLHRFYQVNPRAAQRYLRKRRVPKENIRKLFSIFKRYDRSALDLE